MKVGVRAGMEWLNRGDGDLARKAGIGDDNNIDIRRVKNDC